MSEDSKPEESWVKRRNAIERAKYEIGVALLYLNTAIDAGGRSEDNRRIAVAKTNIETGLLWLDSVEE